MPYQNDIENLESEIKALGLELTDRLEGRLNPRPLFLSVQMCFNFNDYEDAITGLVFQQAEKGLVLTESEKEMLQVLRAKTKVVKNLYAKALEISDGFKNPVAHMDAIEHANKGIPPDFAKRYGLRNGTVKALHLSTPAFEERFLRERVAAAKVRGAARYGQKLYLKRRLKLNDDDAEQLVEAFWEYPDVRSSLFFKWFDRERLMRLRIIDHMHDDLLALMDEFEQSK